MTISHRETLCKHDQEAEGTGGGNEEFGEQGSGGKWKDKKRTTHFSEESGGKRRELIMCWTKSKLGRTLRLK